MREDGLLVQSLSRSRLRNGLDRVDEDATQGLAAFPYANGKAALVDSAFNNLLERHAAPQCRAYWIASLTNGVVSGP